MIDIGEDEFQIKLLVKLCLCQFLVLFLILILLVALGRLVQDAEVTLGEGDEDLGELRVV